jgi:hypothetical protein
MGQRFVVVAGIQAYRSDVISCQIIKAAVAIAQIKIVGIGLIHGFIAPALDSEEALRLGHIQRAQYQGIQHAKNHGVCADAQGQRQNRYGGKAGRFAQQAEGEAQILYKSHISFDWAARSSGCSRAVSPISFLSQTLALHRRESRLLDCL